NIEILNNNFTFFSKGDFKKNIYKKKKENITKECNYKGGIFDQIFLNNRMKNKGQQLRRKNTVDTINFRYLIISRIVIVNWRNITIPHITNYDNFIAIVNILIHFTLNNWNIVKAHKME